MLIEKEISNDIEFGLNKDYYISEEDIDSEGYKFQSWLIDILSAFKLPYYQGSLEAEDFKVLYICNNDRFNRIRTLILSRFDTTSQSINPIDWASPDPVIHRIEISYKDKLKLSLISDDYNFSWFLVPKQVVDNLLR